MENYGNSYESGVLLTDLFEKHYWDPFWIQSNLLVLFFFSAWLYLRYGNNFWKKWLLRIYRTKSYLQFLNMLLQFGSLKIRCFFAVSGKDRVKINTHLKKILSNFNVFFMPTSNNNNFIENINLKKGRNTDENSETGYALEVLSSFTKIKRK